MTVNFNLFNIIILLGSLQGIILSLMILFSGKGKRQNKYFLAAFMLVLVYDGFGTFCWSSGFNGGWLFYFDNIFPYTVFLSAGPSLYLYIRTTIKPGKISQHLIFKAYLPVIIDFSFRICLLIYALLTQAGMHVKIKAGDIDAVYQPIAQTLMVIIFWGYLLSAIRQFKSREPEVQGVDISAIAEQTLISKWTKALLTVMTAVAVVWALTIFGSLLFNIQTLVYFSPIEIILVIFIYWIGLKGYQHTRVVYISDQKAAKTHADTLLPGEAEACIALLKKAMEINKLYLDPALTVNKVAEKLGVNPRTISAVLNRELKKGFSEFVNEYRINEVKLKMLQPENKHFTIAGIAFESGFNSVATFQRTFKNTENITPKQFLFKAETKIK